jgi:hypothetical protein
MFSVSNLIQRLKIRVGHPLKRQMSSKCICMFRLCDGHHIGRICSEHYCVVDKRNSRLLFDILENFSTRIGIVHMNNEEYRRIHTEPIFKMMLPFNIELYIDLNNRLHLHKNRREIKMGDLVDSINLLCIKCLYCNCKSKPPSPSPLPYTKTVWINFNFLFIIDCNREKDDGRSILDDYIHIQANNNTTSSMTNKRVYTFQF